MIAKNRAVYFVTVTDKVYNANTSQYEVKAEAKERYAGVADLGNKRTMELFGNLDTSHVVVRLRFPYNDPFTHVVIHGTIYKTDTRRRTKANNSFIISEEVVSDSVRRSIISAVDRCSRA